MQSKEEIQDIRLKGFGEISIWNLFCAVASACVSLCVLIKFLWDKINNRIIIDGQSVSSVLSEDQYSKIDLFSFSSFLVVLLFLSVAMVFRAVWIFWLRFRKGYVSIRRGSLEPERAYLLGVFVALIFVVVVSAVYFLSIKDASVMAPPLLGVPQVQWAISLMTVLPLYKIFVSNWGELVLGRDGGLVYCVSRGEVSPQYSSEFIRWPNFRSERIPVGYSF